ncbi:MAG TPA: glycosyltransferase family 39 protein, partial [Rubrivivax sp.]|nr:glycosyltransferase family 39 protein [Rubrivivax sp.]
APGFTVVATYLNPDIPELFFFSASFWALLLALDEPGAARRWLLLGLVAGLGYINRQTAAAVVLFVALLCLVAPQAPRRQYLLAGLAFAATVSLDWLFLTLSTGDPAYRMRVDFNHDPVDRFAEAARVAASGGWIDKEGNISVNVFVDPLLNVLFTQKYGLLFWLALPAAVRAYRQRRHDPAARRIGLVLWLGLISFLFVAANPKLYLVPRYFVPAAWAASVAGAWWLVQAWQGGRPIAAAALLGAAAIVGGAAYSIENTDPRATERLLVRWVQAHPGQLIYTDIETYERAAYFFRFGGVGASAVSTARPPPGAHFFHSAVRQRQCASMARCRHRATDFEPRPGWKVLEQLSGPRRPIARTILALGLAPHLPPDVAQRLLAPVAEVTIFQTD